MPEKLNSSTNFGERKPKLAYPDLARVGSRPETGRADVEPSNEIDLRRLEGLEKSKEFVFENDEALYEAPDVPLNELFEHGGFSSEVKKVLDETGLAVITGQSGIGKTELFCGQNRLGIHAGGIEDLLNKGAYLSVQQRGIDEYLLAAAGLSDGELSTYAKKKIEELMEKEYLILDEAPKLTYMPNVVEAVSKLHSEGKKVLLVGGGRSTSEAQAIAIKEAFATTGSAESINKDGAFALPAYLLNDVQAMDILTARVRPDNLNDQVRQNVEFVLEAMHEQKIPTIYRAVEFALSPEMTSSALERQTRRMKRDLVNQIGHIKDL